MWQMPGDEEMTWNHRVLKTVTSHETCYCIVEAYYDEDGNLNGHTGEMPVSVSYSLKDNEEKTPIEDLRDTLEKMLRCLDKPIIESKNGKA
jgi:hypothetical protein